MYSASTLSCGSTKAAVWLTPICSFTIVSLLANCQEASSQGDSTVLHSPVGTFYLCLSPAPFRGVEAVLCLVTMLY